MNAADSFQGLVFAGESAAANQLRLQVSRMAPYFRSALLVGERGSGKADVARALHRLSPASAGDFRYTHAAAVSDADLAQAAAGTLYLVHVERLTPPEQDALLRRIDRARTADTRLICASCCELRGMVSSGRMREQFHARISGLEIRLAPLRERMEDLPHMLGGWSLCQGVPQKLASYGWPGNVDEVSQMLARAAPGSDERVLEEHHVPASAAELVPRAGMEKLDVVMHRHVADVLERCAGNKLRAAEMLGISRSTLYRMLESPPA